MPQDRESNSSQAAPSTKSNRPGRSRRLLKRAALSMLAVVGALTLVAGAGALVFWLRMARADVAVYIEVEGRESQPITIECFYPDSKLPDKPLPSIVIFHGVEGSNHRIGRPLHMSNARRISNELKYAVYFVHYFDGCDYDDLVFLNDNDELDVAAIERVRQRDQAKWVNAAVESLRHIASRPETDDARLAIIGYSLGCFVGIEAAQQVVESASDPKPAAFVGNFGGAWKPAKFTANFPPARFYHGELDRVVTLEHTQWTVDAMQEAGVTDVELTSYPGEPHLISTDAREDVRRRTGEFLKDRLR